MSTTEPYPTSVYERRDTFSVEIGRESVEIVITRRAGAVMSVVANGKPCEHVFVRADFVQR